MELHLEGMRGGYETVVQHVKAFGREVSPRGLKTIEVPDVLIHLEDPADALPLGNGRKVNTGVAAAEALQLIGGYSDPELLVAMSGHMDEFREGGVFHGAYGTRACSQLPYARDRLARDPQTRQAVVTLWDPLHDAFVEGHRNYPCATQLQFLVRGGRLHLHATMRSNDVWKGFAYDVFVFTQLQLSMAKSLGLLAGGYHHHAVSMHLYETDLLATERLTDSTSEGLSFVTGVGLAGMPYQEVMARARMIGEGVIPHDPVTSGERWYFDKLAAHLAR